MILPEAREARQALCQPSTSSGLVLGVERPIDVRGDHTSLSPARLLLIYTFSQCCSKRPWSLFLGFFAVLAILGPALPFIFGRIIVIKVFIHVSFAALNLVFPNVRTEPTQRIPRSFDRWRLIPPGSYSGGRHSCDSELGVSES